MAVEAEACSHAPLTPQDEPRGGRARTNSMWPATQEVRRPKSGEGGAMLPPILRV